MKTIYKYKLTILDEQLIPMPVESEILKVDYDPYNNLCLWVLVDNKEKENEGRYINIFRTGEPMDEDERDYIGTVIKGDLIWHVYENESKW